MRQEIGGVLLIALGLIGFIALIAPKSGWIAGDMARGLDTLFGVMRWAVPLMVVWGGVLHLTGRSPFSENPRGWAALSAFVSLVMLSQMVRFGWGGWLGSVVDHGLNTAVGTGGTVVVALLLILLAVVLGFDASVRRGFGGLSRGAVQGGRTLLHALSLIARGLRDWVYPVEESAPAPESVPAPRRPRSRPRSVVPEPIAPQTEPATRVAEPHRSRREFGGYLPPPIAILTPPEGGRVAGRQRQNAMEKAELLKSSLFQFGIDVQLGEVSQGPTITRFEIIPPPGVKVSRIVNLSDDIALSLAATGVRIEAPIPGKSAVGIEVPNDEISPVLLREVLEHRAFVESDSPLTVALGKDVAGAPVVAALDQMPHLLVAGATGSGKSVLINVLITSLLYRSSPDMVRLLLIDPKVVELSVYNGIPHLLSPVVTDPKKASMALRWAVKEMERRYRLFAENGVRDMARFNQGSPSEERLPYLVVVIDELADLMMVAPGEVEESIARLAQMARAAGIHLVVATQRPSVDVITGTIKANIPSRIAFSVSSQVDSRTILDGVGAEKLLGRGDMLFHPVGTAKAQRLQGAFIHEKEIEQVVHYLQSQTPGDNQAAEMSFEVPESEESGPLPETDPLFEEAVHLVVENRQASTSMLQRRLRVGYTRAARLIDAMEERGFIGPQDGSKSREVHLTVEQFRRLFGESP